MWLQSKETEKISRKSGKWEKCSILKKCNNLALKLYKCVRVCVCVDIHNSDSGIDMDKDVSLHMIY